MTRVRSETSTPFGLDHSFPRDLVFTALGSSGFAMLGLDRQRPYRSRRVDLPGDTSRRWIITYPPVEGTPARHIFAKQYSLDSSSPQNIANEFRGLQITHDALGSGGVFSVPTPYGYDAARRVILMEYCPSVPLGRLLFHRLRWSRLAMTGSRQAQLVAYAARAGRLLRRFQGIQSHAIRASPQQVLLGYKAHFLRSLTACQDLGLSDSDLDPLRAHVCDALSAPSQERALVPQHSDLGPWNVLVGEAQLYLVDFHNFSVGFPAYDAAYFYTALDLWKRYRTIAAARLREAQTAFLEAFLHGTAPDAEVPLSSSPVSTSSDARRIAAPNTTHDTLHLFHVFSLIHMTYFASIVLSRQVRTRHIAYLPVRRRRFLQGWFRSRLGPKSRRH